MKWFVKRSPLHEKMTKELKMSNRALDVGWGNGYIIIPPTHPWYAYTENNLPIHAHGGWTFGSMVDEDTISFWKELDENDLGGFMIGFDTAHYGDSLEQWPKERVIAETRELDRQIITLGKGIFIE
jgi:hypothetical protein